MPRSFRTRPRLAAAAVVALAGGLLVAGPPPAQAECLQLSVWLYDNQEGRDYKKYQECVTPTPWDQSFYFGKWRETDTTLVPPGTTTGAGFEVWIPGP